jgi:hypothetical protein
VCAIERTREEKEGEEEVSVLRDVEENARLFPSQLIFGKKILSIPEVFQCGSISSSSSSRVT